MRKTATFPLQDLSMAKNALLQWANSFPISVYMDSHGNHQDRFGVWDCLMACGAADVLEMPAGNAFSQLRRWYDDKKDWIFLSLGYDLKNEVEVLSSHQPDTIQWPDLFAFQPLVVAGIRHGILTIYSLSDDPERVWADIFTQSPHIPAQKMSIGPFQSNMTDAEYLSSVDAIRQHILEGDVYEMNLCRAFYAEQALIDPLQLFERLNAKGEAPFSCFFRLQDKFLLCASPERFLQKKGNFLISQPIKGTRKRGADPADDERIRLELADSPKDRAENVMIVDLVRNDFARHCIPGSVAVPELFGIYTFTTVHQMISTVSGQLRPDAHPIEALRDAFPMGSMTGAPKVMAMHLIEQYERQKRGIYSGSVGYFDPNGDFDCNVVIRSIVYHAGRQIVSVAVGGAIVWDSDPQQEFEECLLKARLMFEALEQV